MIDGDVTIYDLVVLCILSRNDRVYLAMFVPDLVLLAMSSTRSSRTTSSKYIQTAHVHVVPS